MILRFSMFPRSIAAVCRAAWARLRGYRVLATLDEQEYRTDECFNCPHLAPDGEQCDKCGCFIIAKTWIATEKCPVGRWPAVWRKKKLTKKADGGTW
jgi:hypothetical protein